MRSNSFYRPLLLCCLSALWLAGFPAFACLAQEQAPNTPGSWRPALQQYIEGKLKKADGGYGWEDQPDSHLTPTFAAIGIMHHTGLLPADKAALADFVRRHHPQRQANKEAGPSSAQNRQLVYQQIQALAWLGASPASFQAEVSDWKTQAGNTGNYELHKYPVLDQEMMTPVCRRLLGLPLAPVVPEFAPYLQSRQRANGSYNNAPAPAGGDGNILNTYWSLRALQAMDLQVPRKKELVAWLQACQRSDGGFSHQPKPLLGGNAEVAYTWAAVKALALLSARPRDLAGCLRYLASLRNADGGFGNQPGLPSNPMATFYAIDALQALGKLTYLDTAPLARRPEPPATDFSGYQVYTLQLEAQGSGSPAEAVLLADSLGIHLWGAKNGNPQWVKTAQQLADAQGVPVTFFIADEPYGGSVSVPGFGTFNHILDYVSPARYGRVPFKDSTSWKNLQQTTLQQLKRQNGGLILQISNNEPMARVILDESIRQGGYLGISTIHFGQNFSFVQPYLHQYRHQLPFVSLQDAHGTESWWWAEELANHRTLFIAKKPTYANMIQALENNWVAAVRHDSISEFKTRMLGGTAEARRFIQSQEASWRWWRSREATENRPWAALTLLRPSDTLEVAHPKTGLNIRIRCQWRSQRQTLHQPLVELQELRVDGRLVQPELVVVKDRRGKVADSYYLYALAQPGPGEHQVEATYRSLRSQQVRRQNQQFFIPAKAD